MENIYQIIYTYSKQHLLLNKPIINYICNYLLDIYELDNVESVNVKNSVFLFKDKTLVGRYVENKIDIFISRIYNSIWRDEYKTGLILEDNLNEFETFFYQNLFILHIIFHEIEHVIQHRLCSSNNNDIETNLIKLERSFIDEVNNISRKRDFNEMKKLYKSNYDLSLIERLANINADEKILDLLKINKDELLNVYRLKELNLLDIELKSYKNMHDSPTKRFFKSIGKYDEFANIDFSNLSNEERLRYGLKADPDYYIEKKNEISLSKKIK